MAVSTRTIVSISPLTSRSAEVVPSAFPGIRNVVVKQPIGMQLLLLLRSFSFLSPILKLQVWCACSSSSNPA